MSWFVEYYDDVDHMRLDDWIARHTDDVVVTFGNSPAAHGKEEVARNIGGFFSSIGGLKHHFVNDWQVDDTTLLEMNVQYTRLDGGEVTVPSLTILHRDGELVDSIRIFIDLAPVFAD
jgi:hypothetical protein